MRTSQYLLATQRETPAEAEVISHQLMLRAGMIRKLASGLYTWLPTGLRVLQKVTDIVRAEMNRSGALEVLMPMVQPTELWEESGRFELYGPELLRFVDRHQRSFCLGPTHEEVVTDWVRQNLHSYKQLPCNFYQIQTKFRDEIRPRFGAMRAREFIMKDSYSFHLSQDCLEKTYQLMYDTYCRIFDRLGLEYRAVLADTGSIGGNHSHEFHVLADSGEDSIAFSSESHFASNVELLPGIAEGDPSPDGHGQIVIKRGIEVGHIFQLGTKYTSAMKVTVLDPAGQPSLVTMGCYGIGVSRIVAAAIEQSYDDRGIIWPESIAPFRMALVPMNMHKSELVQQTAEALYQQLTAAGIEVLFDDRKERPGVQFADMELLGIPHMLILGEKNLQQQQVEYKCRQTGVTELLALTECVNFFTQKK